MSRSTQTITSSTSLTFSLTDLLPKQALSNLYPFRHPVPGPESFLSLASKPIFFCVFLRTGWFTPNTVFQAKPLRCPTKTAVQSFLYISCFEPLLCNEVFYAAGHHSLPVLLLVVELIQSLMIYQRKSTGRVCGTEGNRKKSVSECFSRRMCKTVGRRCSEGGLGNMGNTIQLLLIFKCHCLYPVWKYGFQRDHCQTPSPIFLPL